MIRGERLRRRGQDGHIWFYLALVIFVLNTAWSFASQDDVQGLAYLLLSAFYILLIILARGVNPVLQRSLNVLMVVLPASFILITFGSENRRLAPALNRVLPHVEMDVVETWTITRGDESVLQTGNVFQVLNVTLQSRRARGVVVDGYDFELEVGGAVYKDALTDMAGSCDRKALPRNGTRSCYIAFAVPRDAAGGTLVFHSRNYTAWAAASF
jgi:hypothetical protein